MASIMTHKTRNKLVRECFMLEEELLRDLEKEATEKGIATGYLVNVILKNHVNSDKKLTEQPINAATTRLNIEKIEKIHVCRECRALFVFESEVDYHKCISGHNDFFELSL